MTIAAASLMAVALMAGAVFWATRDGGAQGPARGPADEAVERFFAGYVEADGRVVRRDQGDTTVSEGQAYAMLLAAATGDRPRFDRVWGWAREHLLGERGLMAFLWQDGAVADPQPATDADLDAARALALAADRFDGDRYRAAARDLAAAIRRNDVAELDGGRELVVAGPWARRERIINPSYFAPRAFGALGDITDTGAWAGQGARHRQVLGELTADGRRLPPDWATIDEAGDIRPIGTPEAPGADPRYSFDAFRVPLRFAASCDGRDRALAGRLWPLLRDRPATAVKRLDGSPIDETSHPAALVGSAAAARAAGADHASERLLDRASDLEADNPSYYGAALVALGRVMLTTDLLGSC